MKGHCIGLAAVADERVARANGVDFRAPVTAFSTSLSIIARTERCFVVILGTFLAASVE